MEALHSISNVAESIQRQERTNMQWYYHGGKPIIKQQCRRLYEFVDGDRGRETFQLGAQAPNKQSTPRSAPLRGLRDAPPPDAVSNSGLEITCLTCTDRYMDSACGQV
ncbi:unnamed protein product [Diplocarpon coronariae]|uniref:Uncharacterized protein n=1 Tax=Diplocarpon coronariae TaxID=2795749 RepID=A0A218ZDG7_9HELO|nr:hypothetical protein JHW43_004781 [Diplocarpon mali]OWP06099.1 hypothetical protein B2J93_1856 [Marssonina coronariae]